MEEIQGGGEKHSIVFSVASEKEGIRNRLRLMGEQSSRPAARAP